MTNRRPSAARRVLPLLLLVPPLAGCGLIPGLSKKKAAELQARRGGSPAPAGESLAPPPRASFGQERLPALPDREESAGASPFAGPASEEADLRPPPDPEAPASDPEAEAETEGDEAIQAARRERLARVPTGSARFQALPPGSGLKSRIAPGETAIVDLFAWWCGFCPGSLEKAVSVGAARGVKVFAVEADADDAAAFEAGRRRHGPAFGASPTELFHNPRAYEIFAMRGFPAIAVLRRVGGRLIVVLNASNPSRARIDQAVAEAESGAVEAAIFGASPGRS